MYGVGVRVNNGKFLLNIRNIEYPFCFSIRTEQSIMEMLLKQVELNNYSEKDLLIDCHYKFITFQRIERIKSNPAPADERQQIMHNFSLLAFNGRVR